MVLPTIISRIFEPFLVLTSVLVFAAVRSGCIGWELLRYVGTIIGMLVLLPSFFLIVAVKKKYVKNWDLSDQKERIRAFLIFFVLVGLTFFIEPFISNATLHAFFSHLIVFFIGFFLITLWYKISGHMAVLTLGIGIVILWYGISWWPLFFLLPVLGWARISLKRHTLGQVIGGTVYTIVFLLSFKTFGCLIKG